MMTTLPEDLITASEARELLRVSPFKMAQILKDKLLRHFPDPLDQRVKLVSKSEVIALIAKRPKREAA